MTDTEIVKVSDRQAFELHDQVWALLLAAPPELLDTITPKAFIPEHSALAEVKWPTSSQMGITLSRAIAFEKDTKQGPKPCAPPPSLVRSILERWKEAQADTIPEIIRAFYLQKD